MADYIQVLELTSAYNEEQLNTIKNVCEDIIQNTLMDLGYTDFSYIKPLQWNYVLMEIYDKVFKKNPLILRVNDRINNQYDKDKVLAIYNIFKSLCTKYNQEINQNRFLYFTGIDKQSLYNWDNNGKAKPYGFDLLAIIRNDTEQSMSEMLGDKSVNALGTIAKLNHYFGWREDSNRPQNVNITVSEAPKAIADRYRAVLTDSKMSDDSKANG
jgi:hypothetical protein